MNKHQDLIRKHQEIAKFHQEKANALNKKLLKFQQLMRPNDTELRILNNNKYSHVSPGFFGAVGDLDTILDRNLGESFTDTYLSFNADALTTYDCPLSQRIYELNQKHHAIFSVFAETPENELLNKIIERRMTQNEYQSFIENRVPLTIKKEQFREYAFCFDRIYMYDLGTSANSPGQGIYLVDENLDIVEKINFDSDIKVIGFSKEKEKLL